MSQRSATRSVFAAFGAIQGALNALTDHPLAIERLVPFKLHGHIEKFSGTVFMRVDRHR